MKRAGQPKQRHPEDRHTPGSPLSRVKVEDHVSGNVTMPVFAPHNKTPSFSSFSGR